MVVKIVRYGLDNRIAIPGRARDYPILLSVHIKSEVH
jgi:hypothetical protein